jgi:hypothetical protein
MSIRNIFRDGLILYLAYKFGENKGRKNSYSQPVLQRIPVNGRIPIQEVQVIEPEGDLILTQEEYDVFELINGIKNKVTKSIKDKNNLDLLEIKLKQLRGQR